MKFICEWKLKIFFPREDKLHMFKPMCNFLLLLLLIDMSVSKIKKKRLDENDLQKCLYFSAKNKGMKNMSLVSRM